MSRMTARLLLLAVVLTGSGCGTMANLADRHQVYGGTNIDGTSLLRACNELIHPDGPHELTARRDTAVVVVSCVDLPLSVMADTFTLPITCYRWVKDRNKQPEVGAAAVEVQTSSAPPAPAAQPTARDDHPASHGPDSPAGTPPRQAPASPGQPAE